VSHQRRTAPRHTKTWLATIGYKTRRDAFLATASRAYALLGGCMCGWGFTCGDAADAFRAWPAAEHRRRSAGKGQSPLRSGSREPARAGRHSRVSPSATEREITRPHFCIPLQPSLSRLGLTTMTIVQAHSGDVRAAFAVESAVGHYGLPLACTCP
jgi:hypothetical protein